MRIQNSAWEVGYWSGGALVGKKYPSSGRSLIPARRPGCVGSRRDPSDGRVNFVVPFLIPLPRKGAGAFIVSVVDHSYLVTLLLLWPTMPSYPSTTLAVPARRILSVQPPSLSSTAKTVELKERPMVLTIAPVGVSVTQEEASLAKASAYVFSL
ncbi:hypothetical protein B296_00033344 [Ensete ventricosum]|uniref:Uncharacterized protein n=1 Tax=Ensete ventricosum TaxID=4639 RepID=A0A426ZFJ8_ENSVE|nr:hypothetical protein B296_00033344 [Ensete ventricosum]